MSVLASSRTRTVDIAPMTEDDLVAVHAIEERCYPRPWPLDVLRAELGRDARRYLVARRRRRRPGAGPVVGYVGVTVGAGEAHVLTVAVDPPARRRGIARQLLAAVLDELAVDGVRAVTLEVRESNDSAQELYRSFGFTAAGVRPGYYRDNGEGAVIMWLEDLPAARATAGAGDPDPEPQE